MFPTASRAPVVFSYRYDTITDYYHAVREGTDPIAQSLTNNQAYNDRNYFVTIHVPGIAQPEILTSHRDCKDFLNRYSPNSSTMRFQGMTTRDLNPDNDIVMMLRYDSLNTNNAPVAAHRFMAQPPVWAKTWGLMGDDYNCVIRQIGDRITYYLWDGSKRAGTWCGDCKLSPVPTDINYSEEARNALRMDKGAARYKSAIAKYVSSREYDPYTVGLNMRDLNDLAVALDCRIMVWVNSRLGPLLRWDTDYHVDVEIDHGRDNRYVFPFYMTSTRHLELCEAAKYDEKLKSSRFVPTKINLEFKDSAFFESVFTKDISDLPDTERKVYTVVRDATPLELPSFAAAAGKYAGVILQEESTIYKHEVFKDLDKYLGIHEDENGRLDTTLMLSHADFHYRQVMDVYKKHHIRRI